MSACVVFAFGFAAKFEKTAKYDIRIKVFARNVNEFVRRKRENGERFFGIQWIEVNQIGNVVISIVDEPAASEAYICICYVYAFFKNSQRHGIR